MLESPLMSEFLDFLTDVCISCMRHKTALLPNKLLDLVYHGLAEAMGSTLPDEAVVYLMNCQPGDPRVVRLVACDIIFALFDALLCLYMKTMSDKVKPLSLPPPGRTDEEHEEVLHYIGGFVMCSQLRQCHAYQSSPVYKQRFQVIKLRLLEGAGVIPTPEATKKFTSDRNRGGLKILGWDGMIFLKVLDSILIKKDKPGPLKLRQDHIMHQVLAERAVRTVWGRLTDGIMSESTAIEFMNDCVKSYVNVKGPALARKRNRNEVKKTKRKAKKAKALRAALKEKYALE